MQYSSASGENSALTLTPCDVDMMEGEGPVGREKEL